jgi:DNA-binding transcriptional ArsR family regulator
MSLGAEPGRGRQGRIERQATAELRAMAHPVRLRILSLLTGASLTAAEVARELGLTHANASYHLRHLLATGTIEIAGEERIRGGTAKRYRYAIDRELDLHAQPPTTAVHMRQRRQLYEAAAAELRRRAQHVRPRARRGHFTDAELWVDPSEWEALKSTVDELSNRLHRGAKPPRTPGTILVNATLVMFEMEPSILGSEPARFSPAKTERSR